MVSTIATAIMAVIQFLMPTIQSIIGVALETIKGVVSGALTAIKGLVDVFAGIFTGDWTRVWEGVKSIGATEAGITADRQAAVLDRVRFYKNLRSHLEAISYQIEKRTAVKVAAVHAIGQRVEVYPYLARNMESHGGFYCGGYTQYGRKLAVFPNK